MPPTLSRQVSSMESKSKEQPLLYFMRPGILNLKPFIQSLVFMRPLLYFILYSVFIRKIYFSRKKIDLVHEKMSQFFRCSY